MLSESDNLGLKTLHMRMSFLQEPLLRKVLLPRSQALSSKTVRSYRTCVKQEIWEAAYDVDRRTQEGNRDHARDIVGVELGMA